MGMYGSYHLSISAMTLFLIADDPPALPFRECVSWVCVFWVVADPLLLVVPPLVTDADMDPRLLPEPVEKTLLPLLLNEPRPRPIAEVGEVLNRLLACSEKEPLRKTPVPAWVVSIGLPSELVPEQDDEPPCGSWSLRVAMVMAVGGGADVGRDAPSFLFRLKTTNPRELLCWGGDDESGDTGSGEAEGWGTVIVWGKFCSGKGTGSSIVGVAAPTRRGIPTKSSSSSLSITSSSPTNWSQTSPRSSSS